MPGQIVFTLVFAGVGAMLLFLGIATFIKTRRFAADAIRTPGVVVENKAMREQRQDGLGHDTLYYPVFAFTDLQGIERRVRGSTASFPPSFPIGAQVVVLYRRDDPESARIDSPGDLWFVPAVASIIGAVTLVVPAYVWLQDKPVSLSVMGFTIPGSTRSTGAKSQLQAPGRTAAPESSVETEAIAITAAKPNPARIGEPIVLRGANFGDRQDHVVLMGGHGIGLDLQVIEWSDDAVTVKIPDDPRIRTGISYWYRIARIDHFKGGSHIIAGSNLFMFWLEPAIAAPEWIAVGSSGGASTYADSAYLRKVGDIVTMWGLVDNKTARQSAPGKPYMSVRAQFKYDCKEEKVQMLYRSFHSGNMATGEIVNSNSYNEYWKPIPPDNFAGALWHFACAKQ